MSFDVKGGTSKGHIAKKKKAQQRRKQTVFLTWRNFPCRDAVQYLLKFEASANVADKKGCYALHLASWSGHAEICEILLSKGPSIAKPNLQVKSHNLYPQGVLCYNLNCPVQSLAMFIPYTQFLLGKMIAQSHWR